MKLTITGLSEANDLKKQGIPDKIISLVDPLIAKNLEADNNHIVIPVHDIDQPIQGWVYPAVEHIREVLEFTRDIKENDNVLVHCHAGVSRSTAMAIGILIQHGMPPKDAVEYVFEIRDCAWPNNLMIDLLDTEFNLQGELSKEVSTAKKRINDCFVKIPTDHPPSKSDVDAMAKLKKLFD